MAKKFYKKEELVFGVKSKAANFKDLDGKIFNRLLVVGFSRMDKIAYWYCECECGNIVEIGSASLLCGNTGSCGCFMMQKIKEANTTHGHTVKGVTRTYKTWTHMIDRCENENANNYYLYGGRGIKICHHWRVNFRNFLNDMGDKPVGMSIERIDNNGNYEPGNCRWATPKEQSNNTRRNHLLTYGGVEKSISAWATSMGIKSATILHRIKKGWSIDLALTTPVQVHVKTSNHA